MTKKKTAQKVAKKATKKRVEKIDGLGPYEKKKIRQALRMVWHRSHARKLCVNRAIGADGFPVCEKCGRKNPGNKIDHIDAVGEVDKGFIERLFVPSKFLQALCNECHKLKTKLERQKLAKQKKFIKESAARSAAEEKSFY